MKKYFVFLFTFILTLAYGQLFALDGQRKGFIFGGGLGSGFLSNKFTHGPFSNTSSRGAILAELKIGYAISNSIELYYVNKASFWHDTFFEGSFFEDRGTAILSLNAAGITKYFDSSGNGLFLTGGLGPAIFDSFKFDVNPSIGYGVFGGVGYEFSKHWSLQADMLYLNISKADISDPDSDLDSFGIRMSLNFLAY